MTGCLSWALRGYRPLIKTANLEAELPEEAAAAAAAAVFSLSGLDGESAAVVCLIISAVPVIVTRAGNNDGKVDASVWKRLAEIGKKNKKKQNNGVNNSSRL